MKILFFLLSSIVFLGCNNEQNESKLICLNSVHKTIVENHKNPFANISDNELLEKKQQVIDRIPKMNDAEFYFSLKELLASLGDAHSGITLSAQPEFLHFIPLFLGKGETWYLHATDNDHEQYLGWEVVAINNTPMLDVIESFKRIISTDNDAWLYAQLVNEINLKEALEYLDIVKKNARIFVTLQNNDQKVDVEFKSYPIKDIANFAFLYVPAAKTAPNGIYRYMSLNEETFFVQYNACQEAPDYSMSNFARNVNARLQENHYKKVILDLRFNSGGNSEIIHPLLNVLKHQQQKQNFTLYIAIGNKTFSSGGMNALYALNMLNGILIGEPTGFSVKSYGEVRNLAIENTPFVVFYSTNYFDLIPDYNAGSIYPDVPISQTAADTINGKDSVVEWVLNKADFIKETPTKNSVIIAGKAYDGSTLEQITSNVNKNSIEIKGKKYNATLIGSSILNFNNLKGRKFWKIENAYEDVKHAPVTGNILYFNNYPVPVKSGDVFAIEYFHNDGSVFVEFHRCDANFKHQNKGATRQFQ